MSSEPDGPDDDEREAGEALADRLEAGNPDPVEDDDAATPAFELDLDPEDQGTAEAAAANPD
jgi:hypothetical protein